MTTLFGFFIMIGLIAGTIFAIFLETGAILGAVLGGLIGAVVAFLLEKQSKRKSSTR